MTDDKTLVARLRALADGLRIERLKPHAVEVDEAADRIEALEAERQWRPIESAPKDGTEVLVALGAFRRVSWWTFGWWHAFHAERPTHWLPLPPAPGDSHE